MNEHARPIITVFGSSRPEEKDPEYRLAYELGRALATSGWALCNGGYGGTMEASARGAREAGGTTLGVVCDAFGARQANKWITSIVHGPSFVDRLLKLIELGDWGMHMSC